MPNSNPQVPGPFVTPVNPKTPKKTPQPVAPDKPDIGINPRKPARRAPAPTPMPMPKKGVRR